MIDGETWQASWDRQQESYMPDREDRFGAMLDVVEAVAGTRPRLLDLAGGAGSISLRAAARWSGAACTVVDVDDALLSICSATVSARGLDDRVRVLHRDLASPDWASGLSGFDAVLTATALHWLPEDRLRGVYAEAAPLLREGGVLVNCDHVSDDGLPSLSPLLRAVRRARRDLLHAEDPTTEWGGWWRAVRADPDLAPLAARRDQRFQSDHAAEFTPPQSWHLRALGDAGFREVGVVWRGLTEAAVCGVR